MKRLFYPLFLLTPLLTAEAATLQEANECKGWESTKIATVIRGVVILSAAFRYERDLKDVSLPMIGVGLAYMIAGYSAKILPIQISLVVDLLITLLIISYSVKACVLYMEQHEEHEESKIRRARREEHMMRS